MPLKLQFLGGVGTVTGSKYLLHNGSDSLLVDCGLFQGLKKLRLRNWSAPPVDPKTVGNIVLTHAHLDHSGYLPVLSKKGFKGKIYSTPPTEALAQVLLRDSGFLQEKDAEFANKHGFSKHSPALPLYTVEDANHVLNMFETIPFNQDKKMGSDVSIRFHHAGHILGAGILHVNFAGTRIVFSGDLGKYNSFTMLDPEPPGQADYLVVESTYGNREHARDLPGRALGTIINETSGKGGSVLIPAFAVGRAQSLLFHLAQLRQAGHIPDIPIFLDSPMAINASEIFCRFPDDHKLSEDQCREICGIARYVHSPEESRSIGYDTLPKIIISASGMATGGRVLHHMKRLLPDLRNSIVFTGFQAAGTRGAALVAGTDSVKIHGQYFPVRAKIQNLASLSAHADSNGLMKWLGKANRPPRTTFVTHGEPDASAALAQRIESELGWNCIIPDYLDEVVLS